MQSYENSVLLDFFLCYNNLQYQVFSPQFCEKKIALISVFIERKLKYKEK